MEETEIDLKVNADLKKLKTAVKLAERLSKALCEIGTFEINIDVTDKKHKRNIIKRMFNK